ncbi:glycosyltransferase family 32 protein [Phaeovulum sp. W22_SRMD_FR3]|uniref:glycosyltransferase family 32 protein n=1 Tax=Phaeovulum sp. W22_SRMD_FR3 TaxID=3240274 RepID=UPI003F9BD9CF
MNDKNTTKNVWVDPLDPAERARSDFVRNLVHRRVDDQVDQFFPDCQTPKKIVQFWDDSSNLPEDVKSCMESWRVLERQGFEFEVFDTDSATRYISDRLGDRFEAAFRKCYHPSMMSDYFRYSYVFADGGGYIDADDVYHGQPIEHLFADGRLKLQPFCYDLKTEQMVAPSIFTRPEAHQEGWIFYFNTTPLIAPRNNPMVERALMNATVSLEANLGQGLPEVQATTGPGNLTRSIVEMMKNGSSIESVLIMHDWELTSTSQWTLSYRNDARNWRLSNQKEYQPPSSAGIE